MLRVAILLLGIALAILLLGIALAMPPAVDYNPAAYHNKYSNEANV